MELNQLPALAEDYAPFRALKAQLADGRRVVQVEGLPANAKPWLLTQLQRDLGRPLLIVSASDEAAERMVADLATFSGDPAAEIAPLISTTETLLYTEGAPDYFLMGRRMRAMHRMIGDAPPPLMVASIDGALQRTLGPGSLRERMLRIRAGETYEIGELAKRLVRLGYQRVEAVEQPGHFSRRGGILDIFPMGEESGVRLDFFGDDLDSLRAFDPDTQRSNADLAEARILPAREMPLRSPRKDEALAALRALLPERMSALQRADLEERGEEHAARLEERVAGDLAQLESGVYFDQAELYFSALFPDAGCLLDHVPARAVIVLDEPAQLGQQWERKAGDRAEIAAARAARGEWLDAALGAQSPFEALARFAREREVVSLALLARTLDWLPARQSVDATGAAAMDSFAGRLGQMYDSVDAWLGSRMRVVFVTRQPQRVRELLAEHNVPAAPSSRLAPGGPSGVFVFDGSLPGGVKMAADGLMLVTDPDMFGAAGMTKKRAARFNKEGMRISSYLELREGDYVVHIHHGIGVYRGLVKLKAADGATRDYMLLEYAESDKVYVPSDQVDRVQKYVGSNADAPAVSRINSGEWIRATKKARKQVQEMAGELIKLYAARRAAERRPYGVDTPWQHEMEAAFPYEETGDQLRAVESIKADLEKAHPMDRLICGDVGYGKTEVAMRAAFKVIDGHRQVVVMCPTTILAQQHYKTFKERFAAYPITIGMVSRFASPADMRKTLDGLERGTIDIVIGTHKLLGKAVKFHNLGLMIIDEEQRFGVTHKERIKQMRRSVDVLTLSATPIPRTLHMSLAGIRDLSLINEPPEGRRPIVTYIREYDEELVKEVSLREMDRGGQVYFVSNRVEGITHVAERLRKILPNARVAVAHGQMDEEQLEDAMLGFYNAEYDILVCTTIVESGLDVSNVNTIIVDNADKLGMSQLYQLRGRVGRSDKQGYAYLLTRKDKSLTEIAEKRLTALREFNGVGAGYKVAMRDLEIRGAGNLLGREQSGTVSEVGFDLYTRLLSQAINELKGEPVEQEFVLPSVNLPIDANIPVKYIPSEAERILIYKKLTAVRRAGDVAEIQAELEDRFGDPPKQVWNLLALMRLRLQCKAVGVGTINAEKGHVTIRFAGTHLPADSVRTLSRAMLQTEFAPDHVTLTLPDTPDKTLRAIEEMVELLQNALPNRTHEERVGLASARTTASDSAKLLTQLRDKGFTPPPPPRVPVGRGVRR